MCKWGTTVVMDLLISAHLSHTGEAYVKPVGVDECIASIVKALNDAGLSTMASCCGHGHRPGRISLADGREFMVVSELAEVERIERLFPQNIHGETLRPEQACCADCTAAMLAKCHVDGCQRTPGQQSTGKATVATQWYHDASNRRAWFLKAHPNEVIEAYAEDGSLHESLALEIESLEAAVASSHRRRV